MLSIRRPRPAQAAAAIAGAALTAALVIAPGGSPGALAAAGAAPGAPGTASDWVPGDKDGFGTARGTASKVWYTLSRGTLNEVFYPRIDTPSLRDSQFVVTDGSTFTDREDRDSTHQVQLLSSNSLTYRLVNTAKSGNWRITKTFVTDPARSSVLEDVTFESLTGKAYQLYLLHDLGAVDDRQRRHRAHRRRRLAAVLATAPTPAPSSPARRWARPPAATSAPPTAGPTSRPTTRWTGPYDATAPGNVVQTGRVKVNGLPEPPAASPSRSASARTEAAALSHARRRRSAAASPPRGRRTTRAGPATSAPSSRCRPRRRAGRPSGTSPRWCSRPARTRPCAAASSRHPTGPGPGRTRCSTSPSTTRSGRATSTRSRPGCSRSATTPAANRALDFLWTVQQRADGSFPQNSRLDGTPVFGDLQMDEVAFPIVLAHQLGRTGAADWAHVKKSADYVVAHGPRTPQERWENATGYSPATIAAEIAGLVCAADIATKNGDNASRGDVPGQGRRVAAAACESMTATTTGPYSPSPYYLRVTANGRPGLGRQDAGLRRRTADRRAQGRRPELPRPGAARREAGRRPGDHATRSRSSTSS